MNKKINCVVVGLGHIGKRHAEMIIQSKDTNLVAVCDIRPLTELNFKHEVSFFNDYSSLLSSNIEFDVIHICTPNGLHANQCIIGLERGCHIVVEKPMGLTKRECEDIIYKSLEMSKHVFCVKQNRYSSPSKWMKQILEEKRLGEIYYVQINCFWNRDDRYYSVSDWKGSEDLDGGTLFTQFSHFVDIMYWLFGDICNIQAKFNDFNHKHSTQFEDSGNVFFDFVNGGTGSLNYSTAVAHQNLESSMTIIGEKGSVKIGGQYMDKVEICDIEDYKMPELEPVNPPNDYGPYKGSAANHHYVIQNVVDVLNGKQKISTNALEGMKVVEIIERIYSLK